MKSFNEFLESVEPQQPDQLEALGDQAYKAVLPFVEAMRKAGFHGENPLLKVSHYFLAAIEHGYHRGKRRTRQNYFPSYYDGLSNYPGGKHDPQWDER